MQTYTPNVEASDADLCRGLVKTAKKATKESNLLVEKAEDAAQALDEIASNVQTSWLDTAEALTEFIKEVRSKKIALQIETKSLLSSLTDVRNFFMADDHTSEVQRLTEFVSLCERLEKLKQSGFLDTVADTMIRLENKKP